MTAFDGATFKQLAYSIPLETTADVSVRHIPGGNISYIDIGGRQSDRITINAYFTTDALRMAMRAKVGTQGSLVYKDGTVTAVLISMRRSERYPHDQQKATLEFVVVTA